MSLISLRTAWDWATNLAAEHSESFDLVLREILVAVDRGELAACYSNDLGKIWSELLPVMIKRIDWIRQGQVELEPVPGPGILGHAHSIDIDAADIDQWLSARGVGIAARAYIAENRLPNDATRNDDAATNPKQPGGAAPPAEGNVIRVPYRTGLAGRPTSWDLIEVECRHRYAKGERHKTRAEWARVLITWLRSMHGQAPQVQPKTLTNKLAVLFRELKANKAPSAH